ncbi:scn1 [Scenedesmus sp. PABB004]|nr:scn1 [Scenedesmus sp. PABB004]
MAAPGGGSGDAAAQQQQREQQLLSARLADSHPQVAGAYLGAPLAHSSSELGFFFHEVLPEGHGPPELAAPPEGSELGAAAAAAPCLPITCGATVTAGSGMPTAAPRPAEAPLPAAAVAEHAEATPPPRAKPSAQPAGRAAGRAGAGGAAPRGAGEAEPGHKRSLPVSCSATECPPPSRGFGGAPLQRLGSPVLLEPSEAAPGSPFADFPSWALAPGGQLISPSLAAAAAAAVWSLALGGQAGLSGLPGRRRAGPASDRGSRRAALQDGSTGTEEAGTEVQDTFAAAVLGHGQGLMAGRKRAAAREPGGSGGSGGGRASGGSAKKKGHAQAGLAARARGGSGGGSDGSDYESTSRAAQRAARAALANPAVSYNDPAGLPFAGAAPAGLARGTAVSHSSTSTFKGVTRHRWTGKWESHLWDAAAPRKNTAGSGRTRGRQVYLGGFATEVEAARAYDLAALAFWGTAAATNVRAGRWRPLGRPAGACCAAAPALASRRDVLPPPSPARRAPHVAQLPLSEYTRELGALAGMSRDAVVATLRSGDLESFTPRAAPDHPAAEALQQLAAAAAAATKRAAAMAAPGGGSGDVAEQQQQEQQLEQQHQLARRLADAHCHPQLDPARLGDVVALACPRLAAMSVSLDVDWDLTARLARLAAPKVLPGFGIHPWWAHLHASAVGDTWPDLLEARAPGDVDAAIAILAHHDPVTDSGAYATNRPAAPDAAQPAGGGPEQRAQQAQAQPHLGAGLRVVPQAEWEARLRALLVEHPHALVGEIGIDRAATIPGSRARTSLAHQLELVRRQVAVAAELRRPVSVHCVRGYGALLGLLADLPPGAAPPGVMLHSYGGSVEEVRRFAALPHGVGRRVFFSFSAAINARAPAKLAARIAAVPDDRLLLESDQVTPGAIDPGLAAIAAAAAAAKGWSLAETAERALANFEDFYADQLAALGAASEAVRASRSGERGRPDSSCSSSSMARRSSSSSSRAPRAALVAALLAVAAAAAAADDGSGLGGGGGGATPSQGGGVTSCSTRCRDQQLRMTSSRLPDVRDAAKQQFCAPANACSGCPGFGSVCFTGQACKGPPTDQPALLDSWQCASMPGSMPVGFVCGGLCAAGSVGRLSARCVADPAGGDPTWAPTEGACTPGCPGPPLGPAPGGAMWGPCAPAPAGGVCSAACPRGTRGTVTAVCVADASGRASWAPPTGSCDRACAGRPPPFAGGRLSYTGYTWLAPECADAAPGTVCTGSAACGRPITASTDATAVCGADGVWRVTVDGCRPPACVPSPVASGARLATSCSRGMLGQTCRLSCAPPFTASGSGPVATCTADRGWVVAGGCGPASLSLALAPGTATPLAPGTALELRATLSNRDPAGARGVAVTLSTALSCASTTATTGDDGVAAFACTAGAVSPLPSAALASATASLTVSGAALRVFSAPLLLPLAGGLCGAWGPPPPPPPALRSFQGFEADAAGWSGTFDRVQSSDALEGAWSLAAGLSTDAPAATNFSGSGAAFPPSRTAVSQVAVWLDPAAGYAAGQAFAWVVSLGTVPGGAARQYAISVAWYAPEVGGDPPSFWVVGSADGGVASPRDSDAAVRVASAGWYVLQHRFTATECTDGLQDLGGQCTGATLAVFAAAPGGACGAPVEDAQWEVPDDNSADDAAALAGVRGGALAFLGGGWTVPPLRLDAAALYVI